jgi:GNAT superfamily N-acetyltransferase
MPRSDAAIREAHVGDAPGVATLLAQLGYPDDRQAVASRLAAASTSGNDIVFLAVDGVVPLGLSAVHIIPLFHRSSSVARVTAFVVSENVRRTGIGSALIRACERFAYSRGAERLEVTSGDWRSDAHSFYLALGFQREGTRLSKYLNGTG